MPPKPRCRHEVDTVRDGTWTLNMSPILAPRLAFGPCGWPVKIGHVRRALALASVPR